MNTRLEIFLVLSGDVVGLDILPFELIAHSTAGKDG
jgi:hypothetical protein